MAIIKRAHPARILVFFALLATLCGAYEYDEDEIPCSEDECFVEIHSDVPRCWMQNGNQEIRYMNPLDGGHHSIPNACKRSNIFGSDGYLVAYPSPGGIIMLKDPSAVDLQHLKLPNTHDTALSADEDDDLTTSMVQLGAHWWPTWDLYFRHSARIKDGIFYDYHYPSKVDVAYPTTGGAWVANFTQDEPRYDYEDKGCPAMASPSTNLWRKKMRYALTMDDKAEMMKELGATFYASIDDVPGLAKTVDEAIALFEPFKQRLNDMEDVTTRWRFCTHTEDSKDRDTDTETDTANEEPQKQIWGLGWLFPELR